MEPLRLQYTLTLLRYPAARRFALSQVEMSSGSKRMRWPHLMKGMRRSAMRRRMWRFLDAEVCSEPRHVEEPGQRRLVDHRGSVGQWLLLVTGTLTDSNVRQRTDTTPDRPPDSPTPLR